jgi:hypothetical protein
VPVTDSNFLPPERRVYLACTCDVPRVDLELTLTAKIFTIFEGTSPILRTAALGEAAVGAQPCLPPYSAPGVPAAVQAGPCRVPLDPGRAARWLARAEISPRVPTMDLGGRSR